MNQYIPFQQNDDSDESSYVETDEEMDSDTDSDEDSDNDDILIHMEDDMDDNDAPDYINQIYEADANNIYEEKENGRYYIGSCRYVPFLDVYLMNNSVSVKPFFDFPFVQIVSYLEYLYFTRIISPTIQVMQLYILDDGTHAVMIKTYWLRLIQRHWKKQYEKRRSIIQQRLSLHSVKVLEMTGKFPANMRYLPGIRSMLHNYSKTE